MHKLVKLTPELVKALDTAKLPSYAQDLVNDKHAELVECVDHSIWCIKAIQSSVKLDEALETITELDEDFINQMVWKIKSEYDLYRLDKDDFVLIFNTISFKTLFVMRLEIDRIYFDFLDSIISVHTS